MAQNFERYNTPEFLYPECDNTLTMRSLESVRQWFSKMGLARPEEWQYLWCPEDGDYSEEEQTRYDTITRATWVDGAQIDSHAPTGEYMSVSIHQCGSHKIIGVGMGCAHASAVLEYYVVGVQDFVRGL
jgi:hypothetical protein